MDQKATAIRHIEPALRLFAGDGCLGALERELARLGCRRAVILCGRTMAGHPALMPVREAAATRLAGLCDGVRPGSPRQAVEAVAATLAEQRADAVIAIGGGSAMVTARAAVIALAEGRPLDRLCTTRDAAGKMHSPRLEAPKLPIFALPTTPSTATIKPGSAVHDETTGGRLALFDPRTRPEAVFLDAALLASASWHLTFGAALNSFCSAVEGLVSGAADPFAMALLSHALRLSAPALHRDSPEARHDLAMAALLTGRGTDHTGMGLATVISHAVAVAHGVDGGLAKAVALPPVLRFNRDHSGGGPDALAQALGGNADLAALFATLGLPTRLRDLNIPQDALPALAGRCMGDWFLRTNPRSIVSESEVLNVLTEAW